MKFITERTYESKVYLGSKEAYNGKEFTLEQLTQFISDFQKKCEKPCPLRITQCSYTFQDYVEQGWEVAVINYPRFPRTQEELEKFMCELAEEMLHHFKQNRISVVCPLWTHMFESDEAKQTHDEE